MPKLDAPIVGIHFRPPAKDVLAQLGSGTALLLQREPNNAYDENAVMVLLPGFGENGLHADLAAGLLATGNWPEEAFTNPLHIGYVDAAKTGMAKMFAQVMDENDTPSVMAKLAFDPAGKPIVETELVPYEEPEVLSFDAGN